jgi:hypothetical protein
MTRMQFRIQCAPHLRLRANKIIETRLVCAGRKPIVHRRPVHAHLLARHVGNRLFIDSTSSIRDWLLGTLYHAFKKDSQKLFSLELYSAQQGLSHAFTFAVNAI